MRESLEPSSVASGASSHHVIRIVPFYPCIPLCPLLLPIALHSSFCSSSPSSSSSSSSAALRRRSLFFWRRRILRRFSAGSAAARAAAVGGRASGRGRRRLGRCRISVRHLAWGRGVRRCRRRFRRLCCRRSCLRVGDRCRWDRALAPWRVAAPSGCGVLIRLLAGRFLTRESLELMRLAIEGLAWRRHQRARYR